MFLRNRHSLWVRLVFVLGAMGLFVFGYQWGNQYQRRHAQPPTISGVLVRPPAVIPGFRLQDPAGRLFDQARPWPPAGPCSPSATCREARASLPVARLIDVYNRVVGSRRGCNRALRLVLVDHLRTRRTWPGTSPRLSPALYVLGGDETELERLAAALGADRRTVATLRLRPGRLSGRPAD